MLRDIGFSADYDLMPGLVNGVWHMCTFHGHLMQCHIPRHSQGRNAQSSHKRVINRLLDPIWPNGCIIAYMLLI